MAFTSRHKIAVNTPQTLISAGDNAGNIKSINLANIHDSTSVNVDLWIVNCSTSHYIIKNVTIPAGVTLFLDTREINIDTSPGNDTLRIKLSAAVDVDVIINK
tara:strand:- start:39 stop:347 length:309 start_codon:yes stop_codon:yes gene_type:complete